MQEAEDAADERAVREVVDDRQGVELVLIELIPDSGFLEQSFGDLAGGQRVALPSRELAVHPGHEESHRDGGYGAAKGACRESLEKAHSHDAFWVVVGWETLSVTLAIRSPSETIPQRRFELFSTQMRLICFDSMIFATSSTD